MFKIAHPGLEDGKGSLHPIDGDGVVYIPVEDNLVIQISRVWSIALEKDPNPEFIPMDSSYSEEVVRIALFLAKELHYNRTPRFDLVSIGMAVYLELVRFAFQTDMPPLHRFLLTKIESINPLTFEMLRMLWISDLHELKDDHFSPLDPILEDDDDLQMLDHKAPKQSQKPSGWLKSRCAAALSTKRREIGTYIQKQCPAMSKECSDLLQLLSAEESFGSKLGAIIEAEVKSGDPYTKSRWIPLAREAYANRHKDKVHWNMVVRAMSYNEFGYEPDAGDERLAERIAKESVNSKD